MNKLMTKNRAEFHYKNKDGNIPVSKLTEEHLVRAIKSTDKRAKDHYKKSMDLANVYSELIAEYERRHPEAEGNVEEVLKNKNIVVQPSA